MSAPVCSGHSYHAKEGRPYSETVVPVNGDFSVLGAHGCPRPAGSQPGPAALRGVWLPEWIPAAMGSHWHAFSAASSLFSSDDVVASTR